ncbi:MAG: DUF2807 domain-containing protein [Methylococcales bacterium]|nr:DUF2807 domain-containing protein [Methylococcales bacterium]
MNIKRNVLLLVTILTGFSDMALCKSITGQIIVNQTYSSGSSGLIQGNGQVITAKRVLGEFDKLSVSTLVDVEYFASESNWLELTADDNITPIISSLINDNTLSIDTDQSYSTKSKIYLKIYGPATLQKITVKGSTDVNLKGVTGDLLEINLSGTSQVTAQGSVQNLIIKTSGSSDANTKELLANNVTIMTKGSTDIIVTVKKELDVSTKGISNITYYGQPKSINKKIGGIGKVIAGD